MQVRDLATGATGYVTANDLRRLADDNGLNPTSSYYVDTTAEYRASASGAFVVPVTMSALSNEQQQVAVNLTGLTFGSPCRLLTPRELERGGYRTSPQTGERGQWAKATLTGSYSVG